MPYVTEVPERIDIDHLETPSPLNPLGDQGRRRGRGDPVGGGVRVRHRGRRGHSDHGDADLAVRAVRTCGGHRRSSVRRGVLMKISGAEHDPLPGRAGLGRAARPGRPGAHDPRVRAARDDGREHLRDDGHGRRRRDPRHLRRHLHAVGPEAARVAGDAAAGRRRTRHDRRHRERRLRARRRRRRPGWRTTRTRSSAAWSAASASGCSARSPSGWPASSSATSRARSAAVPLRHVRRCAADRSGDPGEVGQVFTAPPRPASSQQDFLRGIAVGAGLVLLGVDRGRHSSAGGGDDAGSRLTGRIRCTLPTRAGVAV